MAYYILVVLTTFCREAAKTWIALVDATIWNDAESFLVFSRLCAGFGFQRVRNSMFTLSAAPL